MTSPRIDPVAIQKLEALVAKVPETNQLGLIVGVDDVFELVRLPSTGTVCVLVELKAPPTKESVAAAKPSRFWERSGFYQALAEAGVNCGGMVAGAATVLAASAGTATGVGAPLAAPVGVAAVVYTAASAVSCSISAVKLVNELQSTHENPNEAFDSGPVYWIGAAADIIGLKAGVKSVVSLVTNHQIMRKGLNLRRGIFSKADDLARVNRLSLTRLGVEVGADQRKWMAARQLDQAGRAAEMARLVRSGVNRNIAEAFFALLQVAGPFYYGGIVKDASFWIVSLPERSGKASSGDDTYYAA